ncbi:MAG: hypothetical protein QOI68_2970, partial [Pseudonocardiales bacterium]|nr:hypothetical protein [Pseudonocardiales bacterium]
MSEDTYDVPTMRAPTSAQAHLART